MNNNSAIRKAKYGTELKLVLTAFFIVGVLTGFFWWGIRMITSNIDRSFKLIPSGSTSSEAKIEEAKKILQDRR